MNLNHIIQGLKSLIESEMNPQFGREIDYYRSQCQIENLDFYEQKQVDPYLGIAQGLWRTWSRLEVLKHD